MADDKQGRDEQADNEERRQREREVEEARNRADEAEPIRDDLGSQLGDLDDTLETHDYPTTTTELVERIEANVIENPFLVALKVRP